MDLYIAEAQREVCIRHEKHTNGVKATITIRVSAEQKRDLTINNNNVVTLGTG